MVTRARTHTSTDLVRTGVSGGAAGGAVVVLDVVAVRGAVLGDLVERHGRELLQTGHRDGRHGHDVGRRVRRHAIG